MAREREVGTLWIGGGLTWMEQLCLKSFVDAGQKITLFSYHPIPNVPEGVILRPGQAVLPADQFLKYERKDSYALFADLFRLHMLRACPGMIWVDADVYCHRPLDHDGDHVFGLEKPPGPHWSRINNAVLGLPADCPMLAAMLEQTADPYAVPDYLRPEQRLPLLEAAAQGRPVHVSQQPWGVWGPSLLSHAARRFGLAGLAQPVSAFYPVTFADRLRMLGRAERVQRSITDKTTGLHLWASNKRELGLRHDGVPPKGSFLAKLLEKHGLRAEEAPLRDRGGRVMAAALADSIDLPEVRRFADIGGQARGLALEVWKRWSARIDLISVDAGGLVARPDPWVAPYRAYLIDQGVPADCIVTVRRPKQVQPVDVVARLGGEPTLRQIAPVLRRCIRPQSRLFADIQQGSGGYGALRAFGECETLTRRASGGSRQAQVLLRAAPPGPWSAQARALAGETGFFRENGSHSFLHIPRGDTLVVTFDNLDIALTRREDRLPWGFAFIEKQGWSMLGVMAQGWTWYRDRWVFSQFDRLQTSGFFKRYRRVVFYGASMGGYAACAFVAACPGADVVAIAPQSTLDRGLVPWETRYRTAWNRDFTGRYGDAATASAAAGRVTLLYDPHETLDKAHAARFTGANVVRLRAPLLGHRLGTSLQQMGILGPVTLAALDGSLTEAAFFRALRARKGSARYRRELFARAVDHGHPDLARRLGHWALQRGDDRRLRDALAALDGHRAPPPLVAGQANPA